MVSGGKDVVEVQVEVGDVVIDIVRDRLQVCNEVGIGFAQGAFSLLKVGERVTDMKNCVVGVMSSLKDDSWHAGAGKCILVWFKDRARESKESAKGLVGLFTVVVDDIGHGGS